MSRTLQETQFTFPGQVSKYKGKVREVYNIGEEYLVIIATDRISAFDYILPRPIPYKGQVLNQTAAYFFEAVQGIAPTHVVSTPDPNVTIALRCKPVMIEVVVRGYLSGHAWRVYKSGLREICGVPLPDGLRESDPLPEPIITPATKSTIGHDEDISEYEILKSGILEPDEWGQIKYYALELYKKGAAMADSRDLILVDTKYEFGERDGQFYLIDEVHTPDSSRYFHRKGYQERQDAGIAQEQLSKEFVREWLMSQGFQGLDGQQMPEMPDSFVDTVSERYIGLYEQVTGRRFVRVDNTRMEERIYENVLKELNQLP
ncbi:MAG: phosphoribosylaminoimidazolesuccinocarboxamide synthase [Bacteroidia bacterium]|jgi:phosphoribosylaminoimidazole-succinocarboxamide synthase|nr:phosphoribosylaminoimidazolesuccinocarboxamide synthase [Bacteroidia bacterium]